jgi:hypothetical protein
MDGRWLTVAVSAITVPFFQLHAWIRPQLTATGSGQRNGLLVGLGVPNCLSFPFLC